MLLQVWVQQLMDRYLNMQHMEWQSLHAAANANLKNTFIVVTDLMAQLQQAGAEQEEGPLLHELYAKLSRANSNIARLSLEIRRLEAVAVKVQRR